MKKSSRTLALHRDTLRILGAAALRDANAGINTQTCTLVISCQGGCPTSPCPSRVQNCTLFC